MKVKYSDITLFRKAEENGLVASTLGFLAKINQTEKAKELTQYFRENYSDYDGSFDEYESEDILYFINDFAKKHDIDILPLDFPMTDGTDLHLLPITDNIKLHILVADEYYGDGDYSKYIAIQYFVINEHTKKDEVDTLIDFLKELSSFK